jgi:hypothetical protein
MITYELKIDILTLFPIQVLQFLLKKSLLSRQKFRSDFSEESDLSRKKTLKILTLGFIKETRERPPWRPIYKPHSHSIQTLLCTLNIKDHAPPEKRL